MRFESSPGGDSRGASRLSSGDVHPLQQGRCQAGLVKRKRRFCDVFPLFSGDRSVRELAKSLSGRLQRTCPDMSGVWVPKVAARRVGQSRARDRAGIRGPEREIVRCEPSGEAAGRDSGMS